MSHISAAAAHIALLRKQAMAEPLPQEQPVMDPEQEAIEREQAELDAAQKELNMARQKAKLAKQNFELQRDELNAVKAKAAYEAESEEFESEQEQLEAERAQAEAQAQVPAPEPANQMQMAAMQAQVPKTARLHAPFYFGIVDQASLHMFQPRLFKMAASPDQPFDFGGMLDRVNAAKNRMADTAWNKASNFFSNVGRNIKNRVAGASALLRPTPAAPTKPVKGRAPAGGRSVDPTKGTYLKEPPKTLKTGTPPPAGSTPAPVRSRSFPRGKHTAKYRRGGVMIYDIGGVHPDTLRKYTRPQPLKTDQIYAPGSYQDIISRRAAAKERSHARSAANRAYDKRYFDKEMRLYDKGLVTPEDRKRANDLAYAKKKLLDRDIATVRESMRPKPKTTTP